MVNAFPFLMASTTPRERHHAFGVQAAVSPLFGFAGNLVAGFLPGLFSRLLRISMDQPAPYRFPLLIIPVIYLVASMLMAATQKVNPTEPQSRRAESSVAAPIVVLLAIIAVFQLLRMGGVWAARIFLNVYMDAGLHAPTALIGAIAACGQLIGAFAALVMPIIAKRWSRFGAVLLTSLGLLFGLLVMAFIPNWLGVGLGYVCAIGCASICNAAVNVHSQEIIRPDLRPVMAGTMITTMGLGGASMTIAGGYIIASRGYQSLFLTAAVLIAASAAVFWFYFRVPRGELARDASREDENAK
jgi:predicted MFS family arabinose efflux permease